jgi:hypothetical protein
MTESADGVRVRCVTEWLLTLPARAMPGMRSSLDAMTSVAPVRRLMQISHMEASNVSRASWSTRHPGPTSRVLICVDTRLSSPLWLTTTPFGKPVDPEV